MTIGDLKQRMNRDELQTWIAYIEENGPLNMALRIEAAIARAAVPFMGKQVTMKDLMPWPRAQEEPATLADTFALFKGLAKPNDRKH